MGDLGPKAQLVPLLPSEKGHTLTISTLLEATGKERYHRNHQPPGANCSNTVSGQGHDLG